MPAANATPSAEPGCERSFSNGRPMTSAVTCVHILELAPAVGDPHPLGVQAQLSEDVEVMSKAEGDGLEQGAEQVATGVREAHAHEGTPAPVDR